MSELRKKVTRFTNSIRRLLNQPQKPIPTGAKRGRLHEPLPGEQPNVQKAKAAVKGSVGIVVTKADGTVIDYGVHQARAVPREEGT